MLWVMLFMLWVMLNGNPNWIAGCTSCVLCWVPWLVPPKLRGNSMGDKLNPVKFVCAVPCCGAISFRTSCSIGILSFWWDLEKFSQKSVPSHMFLRCGDYLILDRTYKSFWGDLESFDKKLWPVRHFFRGVDYLKFLMRLGKIFTKKCAQSYVSSLWRLSFVFDGTWKVSTKRCDQLHVFAVQTILSFWMGLRKVSTKRCDQLHIFFAVQTILSFWWDLEKFSQKSVPSHMFFRCGDYLKFWIVW